MDPKLAKWLRWLKVIYDELGELVLYKQVFWDVQAVIKDNPRIHKPSIFYTFLGQTYTTHTIAGIRRQVKCGTQSISFARLLTDIAASPRILSRKYFVGLYEGSVVIDRADADFTAYAKSDGPYVSSEMVEQDLLELENVSRKIEQYADRRVAHTDTREVVTLLMYKDLDDCLEFLDQLYVRYYMIFHAGHMTTILPTLRHDWRAVFYEPWIPRKQRRSG
jgi:hypothetical protein